MGPDLILIQPLPPFKKFIVQRDMCWLRLRIKVICINMNILQNPWFLKRQLSTVTDVTLFLDIASYIPECRYPITNFGTLHNAAENHMLIIKSRNLHHRDIELWVIGMLFPTVAHCDKIWLIMLVFEVFAIEEFTVYRLASRAITIGNITCLDKKVGNNPMEMISFIM